VPLLNHAIEVMELYLDAASSAIASTEPPSHAELHSTRPQQMEPKLLRVSASDDLRQLRHDPLEQGLVHRARRAVSRQLSRLEAFVDNLGPSDAGDGGSGGLGSFGRCSSESSFSCSTSVVSSTEASDDTRAEPCLTAGEMISRALLLPIILQVQVVRMMVSTASSFACLIAGIGCTMLERGAVHCARRTLKGVCKIASHFAIIRRAACLVDAVLVYVPCVRRVIELALIDGDTTLSNGSNEGGTGSCTRKCTTGSPSPPR